MSGVDVRCPASVSARSGVRVRCVCTGDFVECVGAAGSHTVRGARGWPSCRIRERLDRLPEPAWLRVRDCLASHRTGSSGWSRRLRSVVIVGGPRASRRASESLPGWTAAYARGRSAAASCSERRQRRAGDALTCNVGVEVRGFEPLASSVRVSGSSPLCRPAFPQVAIDRQGRS
jgi:hypothetical protein